MDRPFHSQIHCSVMTIALLFSVLLLPISLAIQCFSCKGHGLNELAANINCLENGYLENCDDFYEYYSKVEDKKVLTDAYYYEDEEGEYYYEDVGYYDTAPGVNERVRRQASSNVLKQGQPGSREKTTFTYVKPTNAPAKEGSPKGNAVQTKATNDTGQAGSMKRAASLKQMTLPKDSEQHCYSSTVRVDWEEYHVEKGCRKVDYCRTDIDTKPEWGNPWNFCCDKSRCNAKQVKDKPQRIYGMNCRRTDDCIQGHVTRHVCPHLYKSCPKIPPTLIKMECVARGIDPSDLRERYRNPFQEKKCLCTEGNFPRGPICTSAASSFGFTVVHTALVFASIHMLSIWISL